MTFSERRYVYIHTCTYRYVHILHVHTYIYTNITIFKFIYLLIWLHWVLVAACKFLVVACGIQFPDQESNLGFLHWKPRALATGPPRKSTYNSFIISNYLHCKEKKLIYPLYFQYSFVSLLGFWSSWKMEFNFSVDL